MRLTPGQDPDQIQKVLQDYLNAQNVRHQLPFEFNKIGLSAKAWKGDLSKPFTKKYFEALGECFNRVAAMPSGGTLPLLEDFKKAFPNMEMIVAGIEDPDTSAHSHNESQHLGVFRMAMNSLIHFLNKAGTIDYPRIPHTEYI